jgi:cytochrome c peroxidase
VLVRLLLVSSVLVTCAAVAAACSSSDSSPGGTQPPGTVTPPPNAPPVIPPGTAPTPPPAPPPLPAGATDLSPLPVVPDDSTNAFADNADAATLGQMLFFDKSYSGPLTVGDDGTNGGLGAVNDTGKVACVSCHGSPGTDDNRSKPNNVSLGTDFGTRNALPIVNSSFYKWTNWAGRFDSQWSLPLAVAENAKIMKSTRLAVAHMLWNKYKADYNKVFPTPLDPALDPAAADAARFPASGKPKALVTDPDGAWEGMAPADQVIANRIFANYGKAIAAYIRLVVSRNAPFDRYVAGDPTAIDASSQRGLVLFLGKGKCVSCHKGPDFSDNDFHDLGIPQTGPHVPATDLGRFTDVASLLASPFNVNGAYSDNTSTNKLTGVSQTADQTGRFRTKSLRGIGSSAPYMHTGQFAALTDVVDFYDKGGGDAPDGGAKDPLLAPLGLTADEKTDLVAFLKTLDGDPVPAALLKDTSR